MKIIVCIKQVIDPEAPPSSFKIDTVTNKVVLPADIPPVIDPYGEYALEAALKLKDVCGGKIIVISLGKNLLREVIKKPLSMGADELILLEHDAFTNGDSWATAYVLSMAIKKIGEYNLILCGRQSADRGAGQVGSGIAEILGLPSITLARNIDISNDKAIIESATDDGYVIIETMLPALVTVSNEIGEPRYPTIRGIMAAKKREPTVWTPTDIDIDLSQMGAISRRSYLVKLYQPVQERKCEIINGATPEEAAVDLAQRLRQEKLL
jgi:electron transfer flavoprotein beta subunit